MKIRFRCHSTEIKEEIWEVSIPNDDLFEATVPLSELIADLLHAGEATWVGDENEIVTERDVIAILEEEEKEPPCPPTPCYPPRGGTPS